MPLSSIPHIIPILSGKGGVGKSSVTVQLALSLCLAGHTVGILDIDLTGPSIPRLLGVEAAKVRQAPGGWLPVQVHPILPRNADTATAEGGGNATRIGALHCMSLGFLLRARGDAVVWRGPKKTAMVGQLLSEVLWPAETTFLLIDTPPGTSDEHIALVTALLGPELAGAGAGAAGGVVTPPGAVVVTTPQAVSTADVRKELTFCARVGLRVRGVVENMAGYVCPCCGEVTNVFSKGGGEVMAREWGVRFLGSVPIDGDGWGMLVEEGRRPRYAAAAGAESANGDSGQAEDAAVSNGTAELDDAPLVDKYTSCSLTPIFERIAEQLVQGEGELPRAPAAAE